MKRIISPIALLFIITAPVLAQTGSFITVEGEVLKPLKLSVPSLAKYPGTEIKAKDKEGKEHTYKGTLLSVVLDSAGVTLGKQLRGEHLAKYVLIKAADGYEVVFSLAEIDPEFTSNKVLLATQVDGHGLPDGEGPFRLVHPMDKKPARWIRQITSIHILVSGK